MSHLPPGEEGVFVCVCMFGGERGSSGYMWILITAHQRSLGQGNVFTSVCHSVHGGSISEGVLHWGVGGWADPPPHRILRDTVNEWAIRILLECILVSG